MKAPPECRGRGGRMALAHTGPSSAPSTRPPQLPHADAWAHLAALLPDERRDADASLRRHLAGGADAGRMATHDVRRRARWTALSPFLNHKPASALEPDTAGRHLMICGRPSAPHLNDAVLAGRRFRILPLRRLGLSTVPAFRRRRRGVAPSQLYFRTAAPRRDTTCCSSCGTSRRRCEPWPSG